VSDPYYADESVTLYHGDCREVLAGIGDAFDCVITDPPYSSGGFQEAGKSSGSIGTRGSETIALDNLSTRGYERLMREVLRFCNQADEIYMFTDWRMWINTFDALEAGGWRVRNMLVWDKVQMGMGMPWRNQHELIAYGKRTPAQIIDGKRGNVLQSRRSGNANHPTEKPVGLMSQLVTNTKANTILDPFAGSGTTLVAAKQGGIKSIGIEVHERYCEVIAKRLEQGVLDFGEPA
jgi:DNA modification methylase